MNEKNSVWIKTDEERLQALIADEAKGAKMLNEVHETVRQLKAKSSFRLALLNQLIEDRKDGKD
jgi:hypothetical protein